MAPVIASLSFCRHGWLPEYWQNFLRRKCSAIFERGSYSFFLLQRKSLLFFFPVASGNFSLKMKLGESLVVAVFQFDPF